MDHQTASIFIHDNSDLDNMNINDVDEIDISDTINIDSDHKVGMLQW